MMCQIEAIAVAGAYVVMVAFNALASADLFGGKGVGEIFNNKPTYLTPDDVTFAVWGLIYLLQALMVMYQLCKLPDDTEALLQKTFLGLNVRWRIVIAFVLNAAWLPLWRNKEFSDALVVILACLGALLTVYKDLRPGTVGNLRDAFLLTTGISANVSWVVVATCFNIFFCLGRAGWKDEYRVAGTPQAASVVCVGVFLIAVILVVQGKDLVYGLVAGWALSGIHYMQALEDDTRFPPQAMDKTLATVSGLLSLLVWVTVLSRAVILCYSACRAGQRKEAANAPKSVSASSTSAPRATGAEEASSVVVVVEAASAAAATTATTSTAV